MAAEKTRLEIAGSYLKQLPGVRLEWSLKVDESKIMPRNQLSFFLGRENADNRLEFDRLSGLLERLNCPQEIIERQRNISPFSLTQGISLSLNDDDQDNCIYLHHKDMYAQQVKRDAYRWNDSGLIEHRFYEFYFFSELPEDKSPLNYVHPRYKNRLESLLDDRRLRLQSGFLLQYQDHRVMEIYVTYPWHPTVESIFGDDLDVCFEDKAVTQYKSLHFRHIGLSSFEDENPCMTFYFSAPLRSKWPDNLEEAQAEVRLSAQALHALLSKCP